LVIDNGSSAALIVATDLIEFGDTTSLRGAAHMRPARRRRGNEAALRTPLRQPCRIAA
jgi:hypothetical protein